MGPASSHFMCPSAQPEMANSVIFGVVRGTAEKPRLAYLVEPQPVTRELLLLTTPVKPTEVFRIAAPCAGDACRHFDGTNCQLARRIVNLVPAVVATLPPCHIRPNCRWWQQEGRAACVRCPQIVTESEQRDKLLVEASGVGTAEEFTNGAEKSTMQRLADEGEGHC
jgi:hypothetical protein